jgi:hypothetical protein
MLIFYNLCCFTIFHYLKRHIAFIKANVLERVIQMISLEKKDKDGLGFNAHKKWRSLNRKQI